MTEPGAKALRAYYRSVNRWKDFLAYLKLLEQEPERFQTITVDTVDNLYTMCFQHVCKEAGIDHPSDLNDYGKSWGMIRTEFASGINRLLASNRGTIFVSHAKLNEITKRDGSKFSQLGPSLTGQPMEILVGLVDVVAYYGYNGRARELIIRGDDYVSAGCRIEDHFLTPVGEQVISIPMGDSPEMAYQNLVRAYENQQIDTGDTPVIVIPPKRREKK